MASRINHPKRSDAERLKNIIERKLKPMVLKNKSRQDLQQRFQQMVEDYNLDAYTAEEQFNQLMSLVHDLNEENRRALQEGLTEEEPVYLGIFGSQLKKLDPAFDPRTYSFTTLKALIKAQKDLFEITGETTDRFFFKLKINSLETQSSNALEGRVTRWIKNFGFIEAKGHPYHFYKVNMLNEYRKTLVNPGQKVRFKVTKQPNPSAELPAERNGKAHFIELI